MTDERTHYCPDCPNHAQRRRDGTCPGAPELKRRMRQAIVASLGAMSPDVRQQKSRVIARHVQALDVFRDARVVMAYAAMASEADPWPLVREAWAAGKRVAFPRIDPPLEDPRVPRVHDRRLLALELAPQSVDRAADHTGLRPDKVGILEPADGATVIEPGEIDLVLVPCLAFDASGARLGKGGGFYDRFLAADALKATTCGIAFTEQVFASLPTCPYDRTVDLVVTESGLAAR